MAPRSQLEITTSSVIRLVKEEASYHNELLHQAERIKKLESAKGGEDENQEYLIKQEVCIQHGVAPTDSGPNLVRRLPFRVREYRLIVSGIAPGP